MRYKIMGDNDYNSDNLIEDILKKRGIENIDKFLNLCNDIIEPLENYEGMLEGYNLLLKHIKANGRIHWAVDPDTDGLVSSAHMFLFVEDVQKHLGTKAKLTYHINKNKRHGIILEDKELKLKNIDLLIVPDGGTNDREQVLHCYKNNVEVLIIDHHNLEDVNVIGTQAVLINPQSSPKVKNKNISGVGVVNKFCSYVDLKLGTDFSSKYLDLVALGNIADTIDLRELETRYMVLEGLKNINNDFIKEIIDRRSFSIGGRVNINAVGWNISPLLNATVRAGTPKEQKDTFEALLGVHKKIPYKKTGSKTEEIHTLQQTMARVCGNIKNRQDRQVKKSVEMIISKIQDEKLDENKIIVVDVTGLLDATYTGLVANKLAESYKRPVLLLQEKTGESDDNKLFGGSARNYDTFEITDLQSFLKDTGFFKKCSGHDNAFGIEILESKVESMISHINQKLKNVEIDNCYLVDYEIPLSKLKKNMVKEIGEAEDLWGNKIDEPLFAITNVRVNSKDIFLRGERMKVIAFKRGDIDFYRRFANEDFYNEFTLRPTQGINKNRDLNYTIIGKLKINEYNGRKQYQVEIVDYTVKKETVIAF